LPDVKRRDRPALTDRLIPATVTAVIYALLLYSIEWMPDWGGLPFISGLLLLPMAVASVASVAFDPRGTQSFWRHVKIGWICTTVFIAIAIVFLGEAGLCAVMAAPLFYLGSAIGSIVSGVSLRKLRSRSASCCLIVLPLLGLPAEPYVPAPMLEGEVRTIVVINAPAETVWRNTVEIPTIAPEELVWTFSHDIVGIPQPIDARMQGTGVGAVRHLRWTRGVTFEEVVKEWQPERHLSWTFRFAPDSIPADVEGHVKVDSGYLKLANGDYRLSPLPNGKTQLTLTTHYVIATPMNLYCRWWGDIFLNDFHGAVLNVIRQRAEKQAGRLSFREPAQATPGSGAT
jgi:hypothetical protein